ncbi:hypothetical protein ACIPX0_05970 [Streptomyces sp. NPDC090075]|uniref:hypothetical protein n=1 Tax=Streptomyces sp. NPDC090075 TaxID=3365937 RepID=UPI00381DA549
MEGEAAYGFIVNVDAMGSGLLSDTEKPEMRRRLYEVTGTAFQQAGIRPPRLYQEDRGDGILSVLAPDVPPRRVMGEWLEYLHQNLRETNRSLRTPLRLRAGLHIGPVTADAHGRSGRAVDLACRLGDCDIAKALLKAAADAPLVVAASDQLYEDVVRPGGRWVEPRHYRRHDVELKEGRRTAWFMVPGLPQPPELPEESDPDGGDGPSGPGGSGGPGGGTPPGPPAPQGPRDTYVQNNTQNGSGDLIAAQHIGTINIKSRGGDR